MSKIIGEGQSGCVFKPPPKCKKIKDCSSSKEKCIKGVSKLTVEKEAKEEVEHVSIVDKIDPKQIYHIGNPIVCDPKESFDVGTCDFLDPKKSKFLIYDDGGKTLNNVIKLDNLDIVKFIKGFSNIFFGIKEMSKHGFIHADIKGDNIMVDEKYNFKLIDFGMSWNAIPTNNSTYILYPSDQSLLGNEYDGDTYESVVQKLNNYRKLISRDEFVKILGKPVSDEFWEKFSHTSGEETFRIIKSKIDLYSLGIYITVYLLITTPINDDIKKFFNSPPMVTLVKQMLDEDFYERYTPQQAYDRYLIISKKYTECISVYLDKEKLLDTIAVTRVKAFK